MSAILHQLPFHTAPDEVILGPHRIRIKPYQIVFWVSITAREISAPSGTARVPVILDTGHNHNFSIQRQHLAQWAGVDETQLDMLPEIRERGQRVTMRAAHLWIHSNLPGQRDQFSDAAPFRLLLEGGIAIYPTDKGFPQLPLIGLRALVHNGLHFTMDPERCVVNLRRCDWRTRLLRWLL